MSISCAQYLENTNWSLLQEQKMHLDNVLIGSPDDEILHGLITFLDGLQDVVVQNNLATEMEVFGELETD